MRGLVVGEIDGYGTSDTNHRGVSWRFIRSPGHRTDRPELFGHVSNHCAGGLLAPLDIGAGRTIRFNDHRFIIFVSDVHLIFSGDGLGVGGINNVGAAWDLDQISIFLNWIFFLIFAFSRWPVSGAHRPFT